MAGQRNIKKCKNRPELNVAVSVQIALSQNVLLVFPDKNPKILLSQNFTKRIVVCAIHKSEAGERSKEKVKGLRQRFTNLLVTLFTKEID